MHNQVIALTPSDATYPTRLKEIYDPPNPLYVRGALNLDQRLVVGVVGSRKATAYGRAATRQIVLPLARAGVVIVSGLAFGIDGAAHAACLEGGGVTIAVLGTPITQIYPVSHQSLARKILAQAGAIVTEVPVGAQVHRGLFPRRNRIIAGLAHAIIVVEAAIDSGSLITARSALEENREVFVVPGPITSPLSAGTHQLLKQGARPVTDAADIFEAFQMTPQAQKVQSTNLSNRQAAILAGISVDQPVHIDKIGQSVTINLPELQAELSLLELAGEIKMVQPGVYLRIQKN